MRTLVTMMSLGVALLVSDITAGTALAVGSQCDASITRAAARKNSCKARVIAKGQRYGLAPDATKLARCEEVFDKGCTRAKAQGDCIVQLGTCAEVETQVDSCIVSTTAGTGSTTTTTTVPAASTTTTVTTPTTTTTMTPVSCGDFPTCNGPCPVGEVCEYRPLGVGSCVCAPAPNPDCVGGSAFPTCGGTCPAGLVCQPVSEGQCISDFNYAVFDCRCVSPTASCAETCNPSFQAATAGVCPAGTVCSLSSVLFCRPYPDSCREVCCAWIGQPCVTSTDCCLGDNNSCIDGICVFF